MRPPSLLRDLKRAQNWIQGPASSAGAQSGNVTFREDIVESVIRTTAVVTNSHPSIPPPLETVDGDESQPLPQRLSLEQDSP